jgi:P-type E1-E2 ATPase
MVIHYLHCFFSSLVGVLCDFFHLEYLSNLLTLKLAIAEDLGQVTHVFTDKTGTLTDNIMQFQDAYVRGHRLQRNGPKFETLAAQM